MKTGRGNWSKTNTFPLSIKSSSIKQQYFSFVRSYQSCCMPLEKRYCYGTHEYIIIKDAILLFLLHSRKEEKNHSAFLILHNTILHKLSCNSNGELEAFVAPLVAIKQGLWVVKQAPSCNFLLASNIQSQWGWHVANLRQFASRPAVTEVAATG